MIFDKLSNKRDGQKKGFALSLVLKVSFWAYFA